MHPGRRIWVVAALVLASCGPRYPELVRLPDERPAAVLISGVGILDPDAGTVSAPSDVLVVGETIREIAPPGTLPVPPGTLRIAGEGGTLLPGLIDAHGHVGNASEPPWVNRFPDAEANLRAFLYCGVTTVLDPGDLENEAFRRRDRVRAGELLGPAIYAAGPILTTPGGHPVAMLRQLVPWWIRWYVVPRLTREAATAEEAREAVGEIAEAGADLVKVAVDRIPEDAPRMDEDVLRAAVGEARRRGLRAVAHIGSVADALDTARAGVAAWMHGVYKERIPDERIAELAACRIPMVPTMVVFESYAQAGRGSRKATLLELETVAESTLQQFDHVPEGDGAFRAFRTVMDELRRQRKAWRENVRRLSAAGVTILAGSDTQIGVFPGAGLHRELELLTEAGLTPARAIRAATSDAARFVANTDDPEFGRVAAGKRADLLLVSGDPTRDILVLSRIRAVLLRGVPLERKAIERGK